MRLPPEADGSFFRTPRNEIFRTRNQQCARFGACSCGLKHSLLAPQGIVIGRTAMAPHLSHAEQDLLFAAYASGKTPAEVFSVLQKRRFREGAPMVNITVVRRFLRGKTHKRGRSETRGRKRSLSRRNVLALRVCVAGRIARPLHAHCTLIARHIARCIARWETPGEAANTAKQKAPSLPLSLILPEL